MNDEMLQFIRRALSRNIDRPAIAQALGQAGWREADIRAGLHAFAEVPFAVPVPRPRPYLSGREFFLYMVMFCALFDSCYYTGSLIFDLINKVFPDAAQPQYSYWGGYSQESIRWAVAHLTVALPIFLFLFRLQRKAIESDPAQRASRVRKWLTYLTLMLATFSLTCDVGTLVYNLLGGEITIRFILKALTVAVIAGGTFLYFLADMRKEERI